MKAMETVIMAHDSAGYVSQVMKKVSSRLPVFIRAWYQKGPGAPEGDDCGVVTH